jgi:WD40 repeat protein
VFSYKINMTGVVTACTVDSEGKYMAVGSETGEAKILNLRSGGVLYDLPNSGKEITCLMFLENAQTKLWLCGGGWDGKAYFWTEPGNINKF